MSDRVTAAPAAARRVELMTHSHPGELTDAVEATMEIAGRASVEVVASPEEASKHERAELPTGADGARPDLCLVLGGDGTILQALRRFRGTGVPVFAVNFGTIGFLSAIERDQLRAGLERAFAGDFEVIDLPGLETSAGGDAVTAFNDVVVTRRPQGPVAELSYRLGGEEVGHVRCDGLVAATPAGSTGYNLANGGPVMAWGVEGFAVSFIAPHTLTARALVVAPRDILRVVNVGGRDVVEVAFDGSHELDLAVGEGIEVRFRDGVSRLAQLAGANFYHRMREKFGRLAQ
jgi:NAD+ kinase